MVCTSVQLYNKSYVPSRTCGVHAALMARVKDALKRLVCSMYVNRKAVLERHMLHPRASFPSRCWIVNTVGTSARMPIIQTRPANKSNEVSHLLEVAADDHEPRHRVKRMTGSAQSPVSYIKLERLGSSSLRSKSTLLACIWGRSRGSD